MIERDGSVLGSCEAVKVLSTALIFFFAGAAFAQKTAQIRFTFENQNLQPAGYTLEINEDGTGTYTDTDTGSGAQPRAIRIHEPLLSELFATARAHKLFAMDCESGQRKVAFTGKKQLTYSGPEGNGSCTFNYSHEKALNDAAGNLMNVAFTLEEGARLASERVHDRLGLDEELGTLQDAAQQHRALEIGNIAPELESIANDDAVMDRARSRARKLLSESAPSR